MSGTVIQHSKRPRKRGGIGAWARPRLGTLIVTAAGIAVATWLSVDLVRNAAKQMAAPPRLQAAAPSLPDQPNLAEINVALDMAGPPPVRRRARIEPVGVPLDAAIEHHSDGYEILNAAELASISQARD